MVQIERTKKSPMQKLFTILLAWLLTFELLPTTFFTEVYAKTGDIGLSTTSLNLGTVQEGYNSQYIDFSGNMDGARPITITNKSNKRAFLSLSENKELVYFTGGTYNDNTFTGQLDPNQSVNLGYRIVDGLSAGTYNSTLSISLRDIDTFGFPYLETVNVPITVTVSPVTTISSINVTGFTRPKFTTFVSNSDIRNQVSVNPNGLDLDYAALSHVGYIQPNTNLTATYWFYPQDNYRFSTTVNANIDNLSLSSTPQDYLHNNKASQLAEYTVNYYSVELTGGQTKGKSYTSGKEENFFVKGEKVTLEPGEAPKNQVFDRWNVKQGGISLSSPTDPNASFTMPSNHVSIEAIYKTDPNYVAVSGLSLNKSTMTLTKGNSDKLIATVTPQNATDKTVTYTSSNPSIVTVDHEGNVVAKNAGNATITATTNDGNKTATCAITVNNPTISVTNVSLNKNATVLTEGDSEQLSVTIEPANATNKNLTWSTSNANVAKIDASGKITAISEGTAIITVKTQDGNHTATCNVTVKAKTIPVTSISLNKTTSTLKEGSTEQLIATITPNNATNKGITYSSSNTSVATVDQNGLVTAKKSGTATITATTLDGAKTASCKYTINQNTISVTGIKVNPTSLALTTDSSSTLSATIEPSTATNKAITWSSSNTNIATVDQNGVITAKKAGTVTITATTNDGKKTATANITITDPKVSVTGVKLNKNTLALTSGTSEKLTATIQPTNATNKNVTWSSDNTNVATVDQNGLVTARSSGSANITVTTSDGKKTATCKVTVSNPVTAVRLNKTSTSLKVGESETLIATITPSNADNQAVTYSSNNTNVATVDSNGKVTAKNPGVAIITVTTKEGNKTATCSVAVSENIVQVSNISLNKTNLTLITGDGEQLIATITPTNATNKNVTYTSSNPSVAYVDATTGYVTGLQVGTATITATSADGSKKATCAVTVNKRIIHVTEVYVSPEELTLSVGDSSSLIASINPINADNRNYTWSSNNANIASVDSKGKVTAKAIGTTTISATSEDGNIKGSSTITVVAKPDAQALGNGMVGRSYGPAKINLSTTNYEVIGTLPDGIEAIPNGEEVVFQGTPTKKGTYTFEIKVNYGNSTKSYPFSITIEPAIPTSVTINPTKATIKVGESTTLSATVNPSVVENKKINWSSSDTSIATVDQNGKVTGKKRGLVVIRATSSQNTDIFASSVITVENIEATKIEVNPDESTLAVGQTQKLNTTLTPTNTTDKTITYYSANTKIATVDSSGTVTAQGTGTTYIYARSANGLEAKHTVTVVRNPQQPDLDSKPTIALTDGMVGVSYGPSTITITGAIDFNIQ
ncbi:MAG: Ig-like domain-containing protein, partial [Solobacterium sp.]|nr:Ig-like domain-containing protein [Solobacterium sp.]